MRASHLSHLHSPSKGKNEEKNLSSIYFIEASLVAQRVKRLPAMQKTQVQSLGGEDNLEKGMAARSSISAWRIPRIEEPGGLWSTGSQRVGHD